MMLLAFMVNFTLPPLLLHGVLPGFVFGICGFRLQGAGDRGIGVSV